MKQKVIKTDKATLLVCELPEGVKNIRIDTNQSVIPYGKEVNYEVPATKESYGYEETEGFTLPEGNWQLLGRLPDITEIQASELVDSYEVSHNLDLTATLAFKDYNNGISEDENVDYEYWDEYPFDSPLDSLSSLLQANDWGGDIENTYLFTKK